MEISICGRQALMIVAPWSRLHPPIQACPLARPGFPSVARHLREPVWADRSDYAVPQISLDGRRGQRPGPRRHVQATFIVRMLDMGGAGRTSLNA